MASGTTDLSRFYIKTALFRDPRSVAAQDPEMAAHIRRGLALERAAQGLGSAARSTAATGGKALNWLLGNTPDAAKPGLLARALGRASQTVQAHPTKALGAAFLLPILGQGFSASQKRHENELMSSYQDPTRMITASLDEFLEKKASWSYATKTAAKDIKLPPAMKKLMAEERSKQTKSTASAVMRRMKANKPGFLQMAGSGIMEGFGKGVGATLGGGLVGLVTHGIGMGVDALRDHFLVDPKRKELFERLLSSDPVLSDAVVRNPDARESLQEAYGTMVRFAPNLSLDVNAVRSFLREAVLGGAGVNYATIKNLVETERAVHEGKPRFGFGERH